MALSPTEESLVRQLIAQNPALLNLASSESTIISKLGATKVSLSDLSAATSLSDADLALVRQGLNDKSFAMSVLLDYVESNLTLPSASETVAGVVEIATTAEARAFTADKVIDGAKLAAVLGGGSLAANGYAVFPIVIAGERKEVILQWGTTSTIASSTTLSVALPITFPTAGLCAVATKADNAINNSSVDLVSISTTQLNIRNNNSSQPITSSRWFAIGY